MPFVQVPKDLTKVKTKFAFNLTKRQCLCFGLGGLTGIPVYIFTRGSIGNEAAALLMVGLMLPFFLFGLYEKDGQPLEKILWYFIRVRFLWPKKRPYQTENFYAILSQEEEIHHQGKKSGKAGKTTAKRKTTASKGKVRTEKHPSDAGRKGKRPR